jgi:hypothetical protein
VGFYSNESKSTSCIACSAGKYNTITGAGGCDPCDVGRVTIATGQSECIPCARGRYSAIRGGSGCSECGGGKYQPDEAETGCIACAKGMQADDTGSYECEVCAENSIAPSAGTIACAVCNAPTQTNGSDSPRNRLNCSGCDLEYYWDSSDLTGDCDESPSSGPNCCRKCKNGLVCDRTTETKDRYLETLIVDEKFYRFTDSSIEVYRCSKYHRYADNCGGGNAYGDASCLYNSMGPLCRLCEPNYFHGSQAGRCIECEGRAVLISTIPVIVVGGVILICLLLYRYLEACSRMVNNFWELIESEWTRVSWWIVSLRILMLQFQVVAKFSYMQDIAWAPPFKYLIDFLDMLFLDLTSWLPGAECVNVNHYVMLVFYTLGPIGAYILALLFVAARTLYRRRKGGGGVEHDNSNTRPSLWAELRRGFLGATDLALEILNLVHALICVRIFQTLDCDTFDRGLEGKLGLLRIDYAIDCDSKKHIFYEKYAYGFIAVYVVLVPLAMAIRKKKQAERGSGAGILSMPFDEEIWFFDIEDMYYRLLMTGLLLVLFRGTELRIIACVYISTFQQVVVTYFRPYLNQSHNKIATAGQFIVTLTITSAYILDTIKGNQRDAVGYMLFVANLSIILVIVIQQRGERLAAVVDALMAQEPVKFAEFADLWRGKNKQVLSKALLLSAEHCLTFVEKNDRPDFFWEYLCAIVLGLKDMDGGYVCAEAVPAGVKWMPLISDILERKQHERERQEDAFFELIREGFLLKRGAVNRSWQKRYIVVGEMPGLRGHQLLYFGTQRKAAAFLAGGESAEAKGSITLSSNIRRITSSEETHSFHLEEEGRTWSFAAHSRSEFKSWCGVLQSILRASSDPRWSLSQRHKMNLQAFRKAAGAMFGLLLDKPIIDAVFRDLSAMNIRITSRKAASILGREFGAPAADISDEDVEAGIAQASFVWERLCDYIQSKDLTTQDAFREFDGDENGSIDIEEFKSTLIKLDIITSEEADVFGDNEAAGFAATSRYSSSSHRAVLEYHEFGAQLRSAGHNALFSDSRLSDTRRRTSIMEIERPSISACRDFIVDLTSASHLRCANCGFLKEEHADRASGRWAALREMKDDVSDDESPSIGEASDDDIGFDEIYNESDKLAADKRKSFFSATNALHDAIEAGAITEEGTHAMIDRATKEDGHLDVNVLSDIVDDELQDDDRSDDEEQSEAAKWRPRARLSAQDEDSYSTIANTLHEAIEGGTLTKQDVNAMIDRATGDGGHVDESLLADIVDELQHGKSQDEEQIPAASLSQQNTVIKKYASQWRSQARQNAQDEDLYSMCTNVLHDAIEAGTLTEEDAHIMLDRATKDDGHVDSSALGDIMNELQHGKSQDDGKEPPVPLSRMNMAMKYAAKWKSRVRSMGTEAADFANQGEERDAPVPLSRNNMIMKFAAKWRSQTSTTRESVEVELPAIISEAAHVSESDDAFFRQFNPLGVSASSDGAAEDDGHIKASVLKNMVNNMEHGNSQDEETEPRRPQEESHGGTLSKESASGPHGNVLDELRVFSEDVSDAATPSIRGGKAVAVGKAQAQTWSPEDDESDEPFIYTDQLDEALKLLNEKLKRDKRAVPTLFSIIQVGLQCADLQCTEDWFSSLVLSIL